MNFETWLHKLVYVIKLVFKRSVVFFGFPPPLKLNNIQSNLIVSKPKAVSAYFFLPTCPRVKIRTKIILFKQILSLFSLVQIQFYLSRVSGKWIRMKVAMIFNFDIARYSSYPWLIKQKPNMIWLNYFSVVSKATTYPSLRKRDLTVTEILLKVALNTQ